MTIDPQTLAMLSALITSIIGVGKFLLPGGKNQNNYVRLAAALCGVVVFVAYEYTIPGAVTLNNALSVLLPAAATGFTTGAGTSVAVKAYHIAQDKMSAPATPATTPTT